MMFYSRLIREEDALLQFEALAWLIRTYGPPKRPRVPSPLHKSPLISDIRLDEMDTRSVYVWAEDSFATISDALGMLDRDIELAAITGVPHGEDGDMACPQLSSQSVVYDPSRCEDPGYFPAVTLLQLAEIQAQSYMPEAGLSPLMQGMLVLASGVYKGLGFALARLIPDLSEHLTGREDSKCVPHRLIENVLCFAICLNLRVHKQSPEQIVATYGTIMSQGFRKKIRQACRQIEQYEPELKLLQILADPNAREPSATWGPRYQEQFA